MVGKDKQGSASKPTSKPLLLDASGKPIEGAVVAPKAEAPAVSGVMAGARVTDSNFERTASGLILPKGQGEAVQISREQSRFRENWAEVQRRWREVLTPAERRQSVRLEHFPNLTKAKLAIFHYGGDRWEESELRLKSTGVPDSVRELFKSLRWHNDVLAMEFSHREPLTDPETYLKEVEKFAKIAGISSSLANPASPGAGSLGTTLYSYHFHVSAEDVAGLKEKLDAYHLLQLFRALKDPRYSETVLDPSQPGYKRGITDRGLIRMIDEKRFEVRFHNADPRKELEEALFVLTKDPREVIEYLGKEASKTWDGSFLDRLVKEDPEILTACIRLLGPESGDIVRKLEELAKNSSGPLRLQALAVLAGAKSARNPGVAECLAREVSTGLLERTPLAIPRQSN
jgi:hypothetical protein